MKIGDTIIIGDEFATEYSYYPVSGMKAYIDAIEGRSILVRIITDHVDWHGSGWYIQEADVISANINNKEAVRFLRR